MAEIVGGNAGRLHRRAVQPAADRALHRRLHDRRRRPETGVIDPYQRVYGHPGLHVVDGSAISANLGVNPSLTITAQAERAMAFWPNKGEADPRPALGSAYQRLAAGRPGPPGRPGGRPGRPAPADRLRQLSKALRNGSGPDREGGWSGPERSTQLHGRGIRSWEGDRAPDPSCSTRAGRSGYAQARRNLRRMSYAVGSPFS